MSLPQLQSSARTVQPPAYSLSYGGGNVGSATTSRSNGNVVHNGHNINHSMKRNNFTFVSMDGMYLPRAVTTGASVLSPPKYKADMPRMFRSNSNLEYRSQISGGVRPIDVRQIPWDRPKSLSLQRVSSAAGGHSRQVWVPLMPRKRPSSHGGSASTNRPIHQQQQLQSSADQQYETSSDSINIRNFSARSRRRLLGMTRLDHGLYDNKRTAKPPQQVRPSSSQQQLVYSTVSEIPPTMNINNNRVSSAQVVVLPPKASAYNSVTPERIAMHKAEESLAGMIGARKVPMYTVSRGDSNLDSRSHSYLPSTYGRRGDENVIQPAFTGMTNELQLYKVNIALTRAAEAEEDNGYLIDHQKIHEEENIPASNGEDNEQSEDMVVEETINIPSETDTNHLENGEGISDNALLPDNNNGIQCTFCNKDDTEGDSGIENNITISHESNDMDQDYTRENANGALTIGQRFQLPPDYRAKQRQMIQEKIENSNLTLSKYRFIDVDEDENVTMKKSVTFSTENRVHVFEPSMPLIDEG